MKDSVSRRQFLGGVAAVSAGTAAVGLPAAAQKRPPGTHAGARVERVASYCEMCFWRCGIIAEVSQGKVLRVEGNPDHPLTQGRLCARGNAGTGLLYDPDRLKTPLLRAGKRGEGKFKQASWDEALDFLADRLNSIRDKYGPESVALFPHGISARFFSTLMRAFGTPNSAEPSFAQCRGPREVGYSLTFGRQLGSPEPLDLEETRMIVLIGSHLGENVFTSQITAFASALEKGAQLIAVDPRFSTAAAKADWWLPIKPGTDIALLLAWIHVLITEKLHDREYVARYANGFDALARHVREMTPEWAESITELPAAKIRETARAMAAAKPAVVIHPGRHVTWYGDDTQRARAMAILTALLGSYGRKGGIFLPTPVPRGELELPDFPESEKGRADGAGTRYPLAPEELGVTNGLIDATLSGDPYPIKAWIVYGQNVLEAIPQRQKTFKAIEALELLVVVDVLPVEQIDYADVVLPEATYLERYDPPVIVTSAKRPFVAVRNPACEPLHDTKPGWWIAKQLAKRLGLEAYFPFENPDQHLAAVIEPMGIDPVALRARGAIAFPGRPYIEDREADAELFPTTSGKIELYSQDLADIGADPLPRFTAPEEPPAGYLRLIYGRAAVHSFNRTQNNVMLNALMSENEVWLHTSSAREFGLTDGERVILENGDGARSLQIRVKVTEGLRRDCAYMVHGFGERSRSLRRANGHGACDTELITRVKVDALTGGTGMRVNFVRPVKLGTAG